MSLAEPSCGPSFLLHTQADREQPLPLFLFVFVGWGVWFVSMCGFHCFARRAPFFAFTLVSYKED